MNHVNTYEKDSSWPREYDVDCVIVKCAMKNDKDVARMKKVHLTLWSMKHVDTYEKDLLASPEYE